MTNPPDWYQLLHVSDDAPEAVIKASYRTLMQKLKYHPDLGGEPQLAQQLNQAVKVLCDPEARALYDAEKNAARTNPQAQHSEYPNRAAQSTNSSYSHASSAQAGKTNNVHVLVAPASCPFCLMPYLGQGSKHHTSEYPASSRCRRCGGAAQVVTQLKPSALDGMRCMQRQALNLPASLLDQWPHPEIVQAALFEVSLAGCAITTRMAFSEGKRLQLDCAMFNAICLVRSCQNTPEHRHYRVGLQFLTLDLYATPGALLNTQV